MTSHEKYDQFPFKTNNIRLNFDKSSNVNGCGHEEYSNYTRIIECTLNSVIRQFIGKYCFLINVVGGYLGKKILRNINKKYQRGIFVMIEGNMT